MAIDKDKLNRLKLTHLSYMTDADRERAEVSKEGFTLDGLLIEKVENLRKLVEEDKRVFNIEVGNLPKDKAEEYLKEVVEKYKRSDKEENVPTVEKKPVVKRPRKKKTS